MQLAICKDRAGTVVGHCWLQTRFMFNGKYALCTSCILLSPLLSLDTFGLRSFSLPLSGMERQDTNKSSRTQLLWSLRAGAINQATGSLTFHTNEFLDVHISLNRYVEACEEQTLSRHGGAGSNRSDYTAHLKLLHMRDPRM